MKLIHSAEVPWVTAMDQGPFLGRKKPLGGVKLTSSLWELPPGKKSFPLHAHLVTEEAMYVVSGRAKVRTPQGLTEVGPGDYVSFPPGGPAHQLINDGKEPLVYLGISATQGVDVVEYPDSDKVAAAVGAPPDGRRFIFRKKDQAGYFEGEDK